MISKINEFKIKTLQIYEFKSKFKSKFIFPDATLEKHQLHI